MSKTRIAVILITLVATAVTLYTGLVRAAGTGSKSTPVGRATYDEFKVKREMPGLELDLKARTDVDIVTQIITFDKDGGNSGWHKHPGPVFISVISGTMTFYDSDVIPIARLSLSPPDTGLSTSGNTRTSHETKAGCRPRTS